MNNQFIFLVLFLCFSCFTKADSLTLTCDFKYSYDSGITKEVPANCTKLAVAAYNEAFYDNSWGIGRLSYPKELPRSIYMMAQPPKCPSGYREYEIMQGGAVGAYEARHQSRNIYYQVRRVCIETKKRKR